MKVLEKMRTRMAGSLLALAALSMTMTSCDSVIYEDEGDCTPYYYVRFVYDYNMQFADAFASQVGDVSLYVFDEQGTFVRQLSEKGSALSTGNYRMSLPLEPGRYTLVAWGGLLDDLHSYEVPSLTPGSSKLADLTCAIASRQATAEGTMVEEIDPLFHGMATVDLPDEYGEHVVTVNMMKDTKNVRVVLQNTSGESLNAGDFTFTITDDNGYLAHDNSLLGDETLLYRPFTMSEGQAGVDTGDGTISQVNAVVAEFTVSRLYKDKATKPMLTIRKNKLEAGETNATVLSIPLIDYALLVKGYYNRDMSDQEYLDRQDEYNMVFFLDDDGNWLDAYIYINSWRVVLGDVGME